jgi:MYXO-CTERM domain-containing protein
MDESTSDAPQPVPCCAEGQGGECGPSGAAVSCDCGSTPTPRSWVKTLLVAAILLAAAAVGAYSLVADRGSEGATAGGSNPTPTVGSVGDTESPGALPSGAASCCDPRPDCCAH